MKAPVFDSATTALVVIDVQRDYFPGGRFVLFRAKAALRRVLALRDLARRQGWSVFWIRHSTDRPDARFLSSGTLGCELHPELRPLPEEPIVDKTVPNSFAHTGLEAELRRRGISTIVWSGMMGWMCVDSSVRASFDLGFLNLVAYDATASGWMHGPYGLVTPWSAHRAFLTALGFVHARLVRTAQLLKGL